MTIMRMWPAGTVKNEFNIKYEIDFDTAPYPMIDKDIVVGTENGKNVQIRARAATAGKSINNR